MKKIIAMSSILLSFNSFADNEKIQCSAYPDLVLVNVTLKEEGLLKASDVKAGFNETIFSTCDVKYDSNGTLQTLTCFGKWDTTNQDNYGATFIMERSEYNSYSAVLTNIGYNNNLSCSITR